MRRRRKSIRRHWELFVAIEDSENTSDNNRRCEHWWNQNKGETQIERKQIVRSSNSTDLVSTHNAYQWANICPPQEMSEGLMNSSIMTCVTVDNPRLIGTPQEAAVSQLGRPSRSAGLLYVETRWPTNLTWMIASGIFWKLIRRMVTLIRFLWT